jgi:hypothetical protein
MCSVLLGDDGSVRAVFICKDGRTRYWGCTCTLQETVVDFDEWFGEILIATPSGLEPKQVDGDVRV